MTGKVLPDFIGNGSELCLLLLEVVSLKHDALEFVVVLINADFVLSKLRVDLLRDELCFALEISAELQ